MKIRSAIFSLLVLSGCWLWRPSKAEVVHAWTEAVEAGFFPSEPFCERVRGAAAMRLERARQELRRLSAIGKKLYPNDEPTILSQSNSMCADYAEPGTMEYAREEQKASNEAGKLESANANLAAALGE